MEWTSDDVLLLRLEGTDSRSRRPRQRLRELLGAGAQVAEGDPWARHADPHRVDPDAAVLRIGVRPSRLPSLLASLPATAATAGLGTGVATVTVLAGAVAAAHALVNAAGGTSVLRARPTGAHLPAWGPPPSAVAVLRAVKRAFDPTTDSVPAASTPGCDAVPGAFDTHRPPSRELIDDCVHCGFCLPTCPTYVLWGEEMDSPRGRIYLMKDGARGADADDAVVRPALRRVPRCMACVTACPSGVQYEPLIEATRAQIERRHRARSADRRSAPRLRAVPVSAAAAACSALPLRALPGAAACSAFAPHAGCSAGCRGALRAMDALAPPSRGAYAVRRARRAHAGARARRGRGRPAHRLRAAARSSPTSTRRRCACWPPRAATWSRRRGQGCCGALALHAGREEARAFARRADRDASSAAGVDHDRRQRRRLRVVDEGVRRICSRRPAWAARAAAFARGCATSPNSWPSSARARRGIRSDARSPTTTPATWRTRRASGRSRATLLRAHPRPGAR